MDLGMMAHHTAALWRFLVSCWYASKSALADAERGEVK